MNAPQPGDVPALPSGERIAALVKALENIRACAGQPASVYRIATAALAAHTETEEHRA